MVQKEGMQRKHSDGRVGQAKNEVDKSQNLNNMSGSVPVLSV